MELKRERGWVRQGGKEPGPGRDEKTDIEINPDYIYYMDYTPVEKNDRC